MRCKHLSQQSYFHNQNYIHRRKRSSSSSCSETAACSALLPQPALFNHSPTFENHASSINEEKAKQQQQDPAEVERRAPFFIGPNLQQSLFACCHRRRKSKSFPHRFGLNGAREREPQPRERGRWDLYFTCQSLRRVVPGLYNNADVKNYRENR